MDRRSKKRNKQEVIINIIEAMRQAQAFDSERGATANQCARRAGITPQYARKLLMEMYRSDAACFYWARRGSTPKRVWCTYDYARAKGFRLKVNGEIKHVNCHAYDAIQLELPL